MMANGILGDAEKMVEDHVSPQFRRLYLQFIVAGMRAALADDEAGIFGSLATAPHNEEPLRDCATCAINLSRAVERDMVDEIPPTVLAAAALTLMLQALDFANTAGALNIDPLKLGMARQHFINEIFEEFGVSPQMVPPIGDTYVVN